MLTSSSNLNPKVVTLDITDRENLIYIKKFKLFSSIT